MFVIRTRFVRSFASSAVQNAQRVKKPYKPTTRHRLAPEFTSPRPGGRFRRDNEYDSKHRLPPPSPKRDAQAVLNKEFDLSPTSDTSNLPTSFNSPPLLQGLRDSVHELLGPGAKPTAIQALALKYLFDREGNVGLWSDERDPQWTQQLLAAETGSGKSLAYLLPLIQSLKQSESDEPSPLPKAPRSDARPLNPRAIVLAPTHELVRQLAANAKALMHNSKLRVLCASRVNVPSARGMSAAQMAAMADELAHSAGDEGEFVITPGEGGAKARAVDLLVATPAKVLEMVRGRKWDREPDANGKKKFGEPEMGLERVEWVVVDEADVLFDPDFQENMQALLADISAARGHPIPVAPSTTEKTPKPSAPHDYPFHLLLTTATIPSSLASYLSTYHPTMQRLTSPRLHRLPSTLKTEHVSYGASNTQPSAIERRLREVWAQDVREGKAESKVLVFANRASKVAELSAFLASRGIDSVALSGASDARRHGSNAHLSGFLKPLKPGEDASSSLSSLQTLRSGKDATATPRVLITTSLLSRGLDFSPDVAHVFVADAPRNMVDFLHRAGRAGRAGNKGKVVLFAKDKGRGSGAGKEVKGKIRAVV